jgi:hypothetical protein
MPANSSIIFIIQSYHTTIPNSCRPLKCFSSSPNRCRLRFPTFANFISHPAAVHGSVLHWSLSVLISFVRLVILSCKSAEFLLTPNAIPDLPTINHEPYELNCSIDESRNCELLMEVHKTNKESIDLLRQPAKVITAEGMSGVKRTMGNAAVMTSTQKFGSDGLCYRDVNQSSVTRSVTDWLSLQLLNLTIMWPKYVGK